MARRNAVIAAIGVCGAIAVVAAVLGRGVVPWRNPAGTRSGRNVLLITMDTTRADRLHCYGYDNDTSPNVDELAADGVRFDLAISTSAVTPISHASILTGLNPDRHGLRVFYGMTGHFLTQDHPTLATTLKSRGWHTGAFISAYSASERFGLHWGFDTFETGVEDWVMKQDPTLPLPIDGFFRRARTASAQRRADATTDRALSWLNNVPRPFFLWVHYFDPHDVWLIPPHTVTERFGATLSGKDVFTSLYDAEVFFMDQQIGRLLDRLKESGEYEDTVIALLADHGQGMGDHGWVAHRLLYQEQIRVPFIMRAPGGRWGVVVADVVRNIDIMPTILEALGLQPAQPIQGRSLSGLMAGQAEPARVALAEALNTLDAHAPKELPPYQRDLLFSVVNQPWKLIYHKNSPGNSELYHLVNDRRELNNLAAARPQIVKRLVAELERSGAMNVQIAEPTEPLPQDALEKLRALGYVAD